MASMAGRGDQARQGRKARGNELERERGLVLVHRKRNFASISLLPCLTISPIAQNMSLSTVGHTLSNWTLA